jgi:hypothetical protein
MFLEPFFSLDKALAAITENGKPLQHQIPTDLMLQRFLPLETVHHEDSLAHLFSDEEG